MNNYKLIAMIPARMGSKRVPKKNLRYLGEKPLLQYPIENSIKSGLFEKVFINTESRLLGEFAKKCGAEFHERPEELAGDTATNRDFTYEFLKKHECDYVVMVNTTSPLVSEETLRRFVEFIQENEFDTILSVVSEKTECFFADAPINFPLSEKINSQYLEPVDRVVWALTAWRRDSFIRMQENGENPIFGGRIGRFNVPKDEACDIDTEEDWKLAEGILESRRTDKQPRYLEEGDIHE